MPYFVTYYRDGEDVETVNSAASLADIRAAAHDGLVQRGADTMIVTDQDTRAEVAVIERDPEIV
ncbi:MAG: hypothetical protein JOY77_03355 [Alphaproteobacteria bacterium]|nr:hypothetical protein [Alphaproteobacteria bacterium]MBV9061950.1 hypothetical protein [Alphaproteobacteria bacterium]